VTRKSDSLPTDLAAAHAIILAQREALVTAEARATAAESEAKYRALLIEQMKFTIAKLRHEQYGQSSERGAILEQLELRLGELEEDAAQAEAQAQIAAAAAVSAKVKVAGFERKRTLLDKAQELRKFPRQLRRAQLQTTNGADRCGSPHSVARDCACLRRAWSLARTNAFRSDPNSDSSDFRMLSCSS
jgi:hypothetical protein